MPEISYRPGYGYPTKSVNGRHVDNSGGAYAAQSVTPKEPPGSSSKTRHDMSCPGAADHYVYIHSDGDIEKPVYVGKGRGSRAWSTTTRSAEHKQWISQTTDKPGSHVTIVKHGLSSDEAYALEAALILLMSRRARREGFTFYNTQGTQDRTQSAYDLMRTDLRDTKRTPDLVPPDPTVPWYRAAYGDGEYEAWDEVFDVMKEIGCPTDAAFWAVVDQEVENYSRDTQRHMVYAVEQYIEYLTRVRDDLRDTAQEPVVVLNFSRMTLDTIAQTWRQRMKEKMRSSLG